MHLILTMVQREKLEVQDMDELILSRFFTGTASIEEAERVFNWITTNKNNRMRYLMLKKMWLEGGVLSKSKDIIDDAWLRLKCRFDIAACNTQSKKSHFINWNARSLIMAASFAAILILSTILGIQLLITSHFNNNKQEISEVFVPLGSRSKIQLPDGSKVWLNSGSTLYYNTRFFDKQREVTLIGEAYFDVVKKHTGFSVNANDITVNVLSTEFNVKSYAEENTIETTLIKGTVEICSKNKDYIKDPVSLVPKQKLIYYKTGDASQEHKGASNIPEGIKGNYFIVKDVNLDPVTSWKDGKLIFEGERLESLVPKLERFFNVKIIVKNYEIMDYKFTGTINEVSFEEVMRALAAVAPIKFKINKDQVILQMLSP